MNSFAGPHVRQSVSALPRREFRRGAVDRRRPSLLDDGAPGARHQGARPRAQDRWQAHHLRLGDGAEAQKGKRWISNSRYSCRRLTCF